jgi:hypothetical protein
MRQKIASNTYYKTFFFKKKKFFDYYYFFYITKQGYDRAFNTARLKVLKTPKCYSF